ncbi:unnamed protein product [Schistosoma turkestanicum]|nr:unnamed protein product [Schistosoma turkestanicum]
MYLKGMLKHYKLYINFVLLIYQNVCVCLFACEYYCLATREKINSEFRANRNETDAEKINELLKTAEDCEMLIRTTVIQMELVDVEKNVYKLNLRKDLAYQDNEHCVHDKKEDV